VIIVRVELHSARTGEVTELARMHICNQGGGGPLRAYDVRTLRGRGAAQLDHGHVQRKDSVTNWPAEEMHVWNLVHEALSRMHYGRRR
jgi:hypothetical protein